MRMCACHTACVRNVCDETCMYIRMRKHKHLAYERGESSGCRWYRLISRWHIPALSMKDLEARNRFCVCLCVSGACECARADVSMSAVKCSYAYTYHRCSIPTCRDLLYTHIYIYIYIYIYNIRHSLSPLSDWSLAPGRQTCCRTRR